MGACASQPRTVEWRDALDAGTIHKVQARSNSPDASGKRGKQQPSPPALPQTRLPRHIPDFQLGDLYDVLELLGSGGGGDTYLARDARSNEHVAIKFIPRPLPHAIVPLVMSEVTIQANLGEGHVNIVTASHAVLTRTHLGIVMEYAPGGNLTSYVAEKWEGALSRGGLYFTESEARYHFRQFINAVVYCHSHGVAHRDLKLDNTLLDTRYTPPRLKLCDFGFAKAWEAESSNLLTSIGTPVYMSPQLINAKHGRLGYDGIKADVWSAGVMLFVMLFGMFPFEHPKTANPNSAEAHLEVWVKQHKASWRASKRVAAILDAGLLSGEVVSLLDALFELEEGARPTMADLQRHPWTLGPLSPDHQAAISDIARVQAALDAAAAASTPADTAARDEALLAVLALATRPGKPGEQPWRLPLSRAAHPADLALPAPEHKELAAKLAADLKGLKERQRTFRLGRRMRRLSLQGLP